MAEFMYFESNISLNIFHGGFLMNGRKVTQCIVIILTLLLLFGCTKPLTADTELNKRIAQSIRLSEENTNELKVDSVCGFIDEEKQSIPYRWRYKISDEHLIGVVYNDYQSNNKANTMPGGDSANRLIYFEALAPGKCVITLRYGRYGAEWEDEDILEELSFTVEITE